MALRRNKTFAGGLLFKADGQQTDTLPIETLPAPPVVTIPLLQHDGGVPARPIVKNGDFVSMGQMIGCTNGKNSAAVHASVSGTVMSVTHYPHSGTAETFAVTIENNGDDEFASPIPYDKPWQESSPQELIGKIALSGVIDFNGRAVPAHDKLSRAFTMPIESLILNAMVTEPNTGADYRLFLEQTEKALTGCLICGKIAGAQRFIIVINEKNNAAEQALSAVLADERFKAMSIMTLKPRYPQHEEKLLARTVSATPDAGEHCLVLGVASAIYIRDAVMECIPWFKRVVAVAGPLAGSPKNILARIGTPVSSLLKAGAVDMTKLKKIVAGGPLSGRAVPTLDTPVTKSMNALLALDIPLKGAGGSACINCGRCMAACPMRLAPMRLARLAEKNDCAEMLAWHIQDCIDCGCCAYSCPSAINLVHYIQFGKQRISQQLRQKALS
jgi:electron transport complex protein RnfC